CHSEWTADAAAIGYATTSHKPAILDGESQHIPTHTLRIYDAYAKSIPLIFLAIDPFPRPERTFRDYTGNRGVDPQALFSHITKWSARCNDIAQLPWHIRRAFNEATTGRPGPVLLEVTTDVLGADIAAEIVAEAECSSFPAYRVSPNPEKVAEIASLLAAAQKPVIIAGGGVWWSQASDEIVELAELLGAPVATSLLAKGQMPETHPLSIGLVAFGIKGFRKFITEADLVLLVGSRSGWEDTMHTPIGVPGKEQRIIHIDVDPRNIGPNYPNTVGLVSDAKLGLQAILGALRTRITKRQLSDFPAVAEIAEVSRKRRELVELQEKKAWNNKPISQLRLLAEVKRVLPKDAVVQQAGGNLVFGQYRDTPFYPTNTNMYKGMASGTIATGFAQLIGGAIAAPDRAAVYFSGDGSLGYSVTDLETLARYNLKNVVMVIANDSAWGSIKVHQRTQFNRSQNVDFLPVNYAKVAEDFNCRGIRVEDPSELEGALKTAFTLEKPTLVDVAVADTSDDPAFLEIYGWGKAFE
ncbi:MAG TPA: thiamine pyrophosphate-binding protein, partial [Candidatus Bathyarchaeia archaeon]|nr:thiamine pyrophosphate-binding protein [Candidatus Bathyarchaeia archaeon]